MLRRATNATLARASRRQSPAVAAAFPQLQQTRALASDANHEIKDPTREEEAEVEPFRKKITDLKKYNPPIKTGKRGISIVRRFPGEWRG